eukprot:jgi/Ulvmu1/3972/UM181_0006.1
MGSGCRVLVAEARPGGCASAWRFFGWEGGEPHVPDRASQRAGPGRDQKQKLADSVHRALQHGSVKRAQPLVWTHCQWRSSLQTCSLICSGCTAKNPLHLRSSQQHPPPTVNEDTMHQILRHLPNGSAAGLSGRTYKHVRAAGLAFDAARTQMVQFVNIVLRGELLHLPRLLDRGLLALRKPNG